MRSAAAIIGLGMALHGCGGGLAGASLDENQPGGDDWLDHEPPPDADLYGDEYCAWTGNPYVGVQPERAYTLLYEVFEDCIVLPDDVEPQRKSVWGVAADDTAPSVLIDVTGHEDVRLVSTANGLLLMGEVAEEEVLYRIDAETLEVRATRETGSLYSWTRTSPSRDWLVAADSAPDSRSPVHVIDTATLEAVEIDETAWWAEAAWLHQGDVLAAVLLESTDPTGGRIAFWSFEGASAEAMPSPSFEVPLQGVAPFSGYASSGIAIDPLDRYAVFPMADSATGEGLLFVVSSADGAVRTVPGALGPVAFTPDGGSIVAWSGDGELVQIDPITLGQATIEVPIEGRVEFFVGHEGNELLVADPDGAGDLVFVDLVTGQQTWLASEVALSSFASRIGHDEVWLVDEGLHRIDMAGPSIEEIPLDWKPRHVAWMPEADLLFLDHLYMGQMVLWDPTTRETRMSADLSASPLGRSAPRRSLSLAR